MTVNVFVSLLLAPIGLTFFMIGLLIFRADRKMLTGCTQVVKGKVVRFTFWENNGVHFPVVEYVVNNITYKQTLKYGMVLRLSSPAHSFETTVENDVMGNNLIIRANSGIYSNPLVKCFPEGSELDVYYDPQKPKRSYVMRFRKNPGRWVFLLCGLFIIALAVLMLCLVPAVPM